MVDLEWCKKRSSNSKNNNCNLCPCTFCLFKKDRNVFGCEICDECESNPKNRN